MYTENFKSLSQMSCRGTCYCNLVYGFLGVVGASILVFRNNGYIVGLIRLGVDNAVAICSCCATLAFNYIKCPYCMC